MPSKRNSGGATLSQEAAEMSQFSQTQNESGKYREEDINNKARDLVRFFLATTGRKVPIKRQEIVEKVMKDMSRAFNVTMERAQTILGDTFGLSIVPLDNNNKAFCVVNQIDIDVSRAQHLEWGDTDNQQAALVMILLSIIFMSGETAVDEDVWKALKRLGLDHERPGNSMFGDIKKLVTQEFVQQGWVQYKRIPDTDPVKYEFTWGPKAHAMTTQEDVLSFVCQIYGGLPMHHWPLQFDMIHGEGAAKAEAERELETQSQSQMEVE